jgi:hypothetical protein
MMKITGDGLCRNCGQKDDVYGYHATKCVERCNGLHIRHQTVINALVALLNAAGLHAIKDANVRCLGNTEGGNLRPADILTDGEGNNGNQDCIDATVVSNLCKNVPRPFEPRKAALEADVKKCSKHLCACESSGYGFQTFVTDICGIISPYSNLLLKRVGLIPSNCPAQQREVQENIQNISNHKKIHLIISVKIYINQLRYL